MAGNLLAIYNMYCDCSLCSSESNQKKKKSLCQVKSGTLFDNVLIADDPDYAKKLAEDTWGKHKDVCWFFAFSN